MNCDHCGSEDVTVTIGKVEPHRPRAIFSCGGCGTSWISTEPSILEQLLVVKLSTERKSGGS